MFKLWKKEKGDKKAVNTSALNTIFSSKPELNHKTNTERNNNTGSLQ